VEFPVGLTDVTVAKVLALEEVLMIKVLLADDVELMVGDRLYPVAVLRVKVFVEAALVALLLAEELLEDAPVMWNGKEYWKILESESSVSWNP